MTSVRRSRSVSPLTSAAAAAAVLLALAGCTRADASITAPRPPAEEAALCTALDGALPDTVGGEDRSDPEPASEFTAGWGDAAIVLRCGVPRPAAMGDPSSDAVEANGVGWLVERLADGSRFTTTYRETYVEVTMGGKFAQDATPLAQLADAVEETVPATLELP
ncbi:DUF3515 domain-containing protein [Streptomyces sp. NPDC017979]|uniref:DUF3515 domain-containing protein n=1 Tax=Streptomyces sp. NPDC017979 TaxID=3365024 RepID=UPI003788AE01